MKFGGRISFPGSLDFSYHNCLLPLLSFIHAETDLFFWTRFYLLYLCFFLEISDQLFMGYEVFCIECISVSDKLLPKELQEFDKTHPRQILMKLKKQDCPVTENDAQIYGKIQSLFSAKPDLLDTGQV